MFTEGLYQNYSEGTIDIVFNYNNWKMLWSCFLGAKNKNLLKFLIF